MHTVKVDCTDLSPWYYAVSWARMTLQQRILELREMGLTTNYDNYQLERLLTLEQFLKMSWDEWMDSFEASKTAQEVK